MRRYWLTERVSGEVVLVDGDAVGRVLGDEIGYIDWVVETDGMFENGKWMVRKEDYSIWL